VTSSNSISNGSGALATRLQVERVKANVELLQKSQSIVYGDLENFSIQGGNKEKGAFFSPILFRNDNPFDQQDVHTIEAFGPVSTIMPYKNLEKDLW
jgi:oxepin-CoA hydrolase/3-oxo-5,6-dehydrosuberyl-CoA semialdehyde dehydrogenase